MNNAVNYFKARQWTFSFIEAHGLEADAADLLLCDQMGWNEAQLLMHFRDPMPFLLLKRTDWKRMPLIYCCAIRWDGMKPNC